MQLKANINICITTKHLNLYYHNINSGPVYQKKTETKAPSAVIIPKTKIN